MRSIGAEGRGRAAAGVGVEGRRKTGREVRGGAGEAEGAG